MIGTTKQLPGPKEPALIQQIQYTFDPFGYLERCVKEYGDIFISCFFGNVPIVIVSNPKHLQELFNPKTKVLNAPGSANQVFEPQLGKNSLMLVDENRHQKQRKLLMPPFYGERMLSYGKFISEITQEVVDSLTVGDEFIARKVTEEITMTIILKIVFGFDKGQNYEILKNLVTQWLNSTTSALGSSMLLLQFLRKDLGSWSPWGKYIRTREKIYDLLMEQIKERRQHLDQEKNDILSLILGAKYDDGSGMSDEEIRDNLLTLLNAGHETTATVLAWALYWIHQDKEIYQKMMQELETVRNNLDPSVISNLPYLTAICQETLRIYPVALSTFPRVTTKSIELDGYQIPANTGVLPFIYLTHHREDLYPNSQEFNPERFLNKNYSAYEFLPFGAGTRKCLGWVFAEFEMKLILTTILLNYELELREEKPVKPARRSFIFVPETGVKMRLKSQKKLKNRLKPSRVELDKQNLPTQVLVKII